MNVPLVAGVVMAFIGMLMFARSLRSLRKAAASERWPLVEGEVADVRLSGKRLTGGRMEDSGRLAVKYTYTVQGEVHTGSRIAHYALACPEVLRFAQAHPAGSWIAVYINPKNHRESVLFPGSRRERKYSGLVLASVAAVAGAAVAALGFLGAIG